MRRSDRQVSSEKEIVEILKKCSVCHIGIVDGARPYVLPMNFGFEEENGKFTVYLHCAKEGKKLELLKENPEVCFETDCEHELIKAEKACGYGYYFASVIGNGTAEIIEIAEEKVYALKKIMRQLTQRDDFEFRENELAAVCILKISIRNICGKHRKK